MLNFLGIGAQKCGTTWLYDALSKHPGVAFPAGKEVHYWNRPDGRSVEWYAQLFAQDGTVNGEITPAYGFLPLDAIRQIHAVYPNLRLIYLIRNPIERAWSSARMALHRAEMRHDEASDQWFIDHFNSTGSLARGDYETCIRNWRTVFHPDQLIVRRYETLAVDPTTVFNDCVTHLGLAPAQTMLDRSNLSNPAFRGDGVPLRASLHRVLVKIYAARISSLARYLNDDLSGWAEVSTIST
jgi:Sulfotransferase domain